MEIGDLKPDLWATHGTRVGLGVKTAIDRIVVLRLAFGAHLEGSHRRLRPVVGDVPDDGEAGAAVGAIDEGIAVAPVVRVEEFPQAVVADGDVR